MYPFCPFLFVISPSPFHCMLSVDRGLSLHGRILPPKCLGFRVWAFILVFNNFVWVRHRAQLKKAGTSIRELIVVADSTVPLASGAGVHQWAGAGLCGAHVQLVHNVPCRPLHLRRLLCCPGALHPQCSSVYPVSGSLQELVGAGCGPGFSLWHGFLLTERMLGPRLAPP